MSKYTIKRTEHKCKWWVYSPDDTEPFNLPSEKDAKLAANALNKLQDHIEELQKKNQELQAFILDTLERSTNERICH